MRSFTWLWGVLALVPANGFAATSECKQLGAALAEHSCFHVTYGPYDTVWTGELAATAPPVDALHTYYRLGLVGATSFVKHTPTRSSEWAYFTSGRTQLTVWRGDRQEKPLLTTSGADCAELSRVQVFALEGGVSYHLRFDGDAATESWVSEVVEDFIVEHGRDLDGDGYGSRQDSRWSVCAPDPGFAANTEDCDDNNARIHPGATESCDATDDLNCNGSTTDVGLGCSAGVGVCSARGELACEDGASSPTCRAGAVNPRVEVCNGLDDNCDGQLDEGELCTTAEAPRCIGIGASKRCGCSLDVDCGDSASGRFCNLAQHRCELGCRVGGNGCPAGEICVPSSGRVGQCEREPSLPVASAAPPASAGVESSGCGCRVVTKPSAGAPGLALFALLALLWRRRRV